MIWLSRTTETICGEVSFPSFDASSLTLCDECEDLAAFMQIKALLDEVFPLLLDSLENLPEK